MDDDLFVVGGIGRKRRLCISTLASKTLEDAGVQNLGGKGGYYIYEVDSSYAGGIHVLAKVASIDAAFRLLEIWQARTGTKKAA